MTPSFSTGSKSRARCPPGQRFFPAAEDRVIDGEHHEKLGYRDTSGRRRHHLSARRSDRPYFFHVAPKAGIEKFHAGARDGLAATEPFEMGP